ncbi:MAG: HAD family phosphatase [Allosphingosinicella sp.]
MKFAGLIFDFDGVVVDSEILSNAVLADALTRLGHPTSLDQAVDRYIGLNWRDTVAIIEAEIGRPLPTGFRDGTREAFRLRLDEVTAVAGVADFLDSLPPLPKAVASSSPTHWLQSALDRFGLARHFEGRLFSAAEHVARGKPHPDIYLYAARELGVAPADTLVLEDTAPGVRAAKAAGMTVVGLCAGRHCRGDHGARLSAAGADHVAASYSQVLDLID